MADEPKKKKTRVRSPAYPAIPLQKAIERAREFYDAEKRHAALVDVAAGHWGYKAKGSVPQQIAAALKYFGLVDEEGTGEGRRIKLSDLALRILLDEQKGSIERSQAIHTAALRPKIHRELWEKWGKDFPSDATMRTYLLLERRFNQDAVEGFIAEYKDTIQFSGLSESGAVSLDEPDGEKDPSNMESTDKHNPPLGRKPERPPGEREFVYCPLGQDRGARVLIQGDPTQADIDDLVAYLNIAKKRLPKDESGGVGSGEQ